MRKSNKCEVDCIFDNMELYLYLYMITAMWL